MDNCKTFCRAGQKSIRNQELSIKLTSGERNVAVAVLLTGFNCGVFLLSPLFYLKLLFLSVFILICQLVLKYMERSIIQLFKNSSYFKYVYYMETFFTNQFTAELHILPLTSLSLHLKCLCNEANNKPVCYVFLRN